MGSRRSKHGALQQPQHLIGVDRLGPLSKIIALSYSLYPDQQITNASRRSSHKFPGAGWQPMVRSLSSPDSDAEPDRLAMRSVPYPMAARYRGTVSSTPAVRSVSAPKSDPRAFNGGCSNTKVSYSGPATGYRWTGFGGGRGESSCFIRLVRWSPGSLKNPGISTRQTVDF
jgi:hypothetical protein